MVAHRQAGSGALRTTSSSESRANTISGRRSSMVALAALNDSRYRIVVAVTNSSTSSENNCGKRAATVITTRDLPRFTAPPHLLARELHHTAHNARVHGPQDSARDGCHGG
jgi:hypothetical protein